MRKNIHIKGIILFVLMAMTLGLGAQTVTLKFTGRDAGSYYVRLNKVVINNLTKNWQETIWWPDTVLTMQNGTGIDDYAEIGGFALSQNNPNPFSGTTDVTLTIAEEGTVALKIADMNGRAIVETQNITSLQPGIHQFRISLSTVGTYVMTARQNGKTSSIKMICNGGWGANAINYFGEIQSLTYMLKSTTNKPFNYGDMMEYIGYATINGSEVESQRITQAQGTSQTFTLQFPMSQQQEPMVTTNSVTNFTATTATCGGNVTNSGAATVTERGVCWSSTSTNPTISGSHQAATSSGTGLYNVNVTGLSPNTTYYVKAYAVNSAGTAYGNTEQFTTLCNTVNVSISGNTTISQGGNTTLTASGASTYHWSNGANTASITVSPTTNTTYTVTGTDNNGCTGTASITVTVNNPPTVTTNSVTTFTATTATCGGNVTSNGTTITERGICWSSSTTNPTLNDSYKSNGGGSGSFSFNISGLEANTTYYVKAYATYSGGTVYGTTKSFTTSSFTCGNSTTDYDGNSYNTVQIGQQCWMAENLKTTHFNNGVSIPLVQDSSSWGNTSSAAYCYYNISSYGCLYNFYALEGEILCPPGWHVPSYDEVHTTLYNALEGSSVGGKMKTTGTTYWFSPNTSATNSSGFSARGGGCRPNTDAFYGVKEYAVFWTNTLYNSDHVKTYSLSYSSADLLRYGYEDYDYSMAMRNGCSVRCLFDEGSNSVSPPPCNASDQCEYTFNLTDSYGDGWNNGSLAVVQNGVTVAIITLTNGSSGTETVMLCDNQSTSLVWTPGSYVSEVGFSLEDNSGSVVCSYTAGSMSTYTTYTFIAECQETGNLPNAPTGVTATNVGTSSSPQIQISWNSVSNATSYKVYRSSSVNGTYTQIGSATSNTYLYDNSPLTGYNYYKVKAVNNAGSSDLSSSYGYYNNTGGGTTVPNAPTGVTATNVGSFSSPQIEISWNSVSNATSYKVYRSSSANGSYSYLGSATYTYFYDNNPLTGYNYYKVKAVNSAGSSDLSSSYGYYNNTGGGTTVPNSPTGVTATVMGNSSYSYVSVSWNPVTDATSYKVYRSSSANGTYSLIGSPSSSTPYYYDYDPLSGYNYYKVKAVNSVGESSYSSHASCYYTPPVMSPCPPTVTVSGTSSQTVSWSYQSSSICGTPTSFKVYKFVPCDNGTEWELKTTTTSHSYTCPSSSIHPGINHYLVYAVNDAGQEGSYVQSSSVSLAKPSSFSVQKLSGSYIKFTWSIVSKATGYQIFESSSANGTYYILDQVDDVNTTTLTKYYPASSGTTKYFKIKAVFICDGVGGPVYSDLTTWKSLTF